MHLTGKYISLLMEIPQPIAETISITLSCIEECMPDILEEPFRIARNDLLRLITRYYASGTSRKDLRKEILHKLEQFLSPIEIQEDSAHPFFSVSASIIQKLAQEFGLPGPVLESLISEPDANKKVIDALTSFRQPSGLSFGRDCTYLIPRKRIADSEHAVVYLTIEKGGYSDSHFHAIEEFLYVIDGDVAVEFEATGLCARVATGDCLQFYSEQRHIIRNCGSRTAQLLIVRFYQIYRSGSRLEYLEALKRIVRGSEARKVNAAQGDDKRTAGKGRTVRAIDKSLEDAFRRKATAEWEWQIEQITTPAVDHDNEHRRWLDSLLATTLTDQESAARDAYPIRDCFGLGRLIRLIIGKKKFSEAIKTIASFEDANLTQKYGTAARMHRLSYGLAAPPTVHDIDYLAQAFEVMPYLFFDFVCLPKRGAVVLRKLTDDGGPASDWWRVPDYFVSRTNQRRKYFLPVRRLADSDVSISILELAPGESCLPNTHPGLEIVFLLTGAVTIHIGGTPEKLAVPLDSLAQYESTVQHQVVNTSNETARILVMRFYAPSDKGTKRAATDAGGR
jgi:quercetin dioxygenase-like cupin family protein